jgi:hypothetical protein
MTGTQPLQRSRHRRRVNQEDLVLQRNDGFATAGIALTGTAAEQLPIDPPRLVVFGEYHMQAAALGYALSQANVGAASGHVGGNRHPPGLRGQRHYLGFRLILLGVEQCMGDAELPQNSADLLRCSHRARADQHRTPACDGQAPNHVGDGPPLLLTAPTNRWHGDQSP